MLIVRTACIVYPSWTSHWAHWRSTLFKPVSHEQVLSVLVCSQPNLLHTLQMLSIFVITDITWGAFSFHWWFSSPLQRVIVQHLLHDKPCSALTSQCANLIIPQWLWYASCLECSPSSGSFPNHRWIPQIWQYQFSPSALSNIQNWRHWWQHLKR